MSLKDALYISTSGYGPCSTFTLAEWFEARDMFRNNQAKAFKSINYKHLVVRQNT